MSEDGEELFTSDDCQDACDDTIAMYEARTARIVSWLLFVGFMTLFGSCVACVEHIARTHQCEEGKTDGRQR